MRNSTLSLAGAGQVWDLCLCFPLIYLFCVFCDWERSVVQLREMRQLSFSKTLKSFFSWEINFERERISWVLNCLLKICICKLTCLSCVSSPILFSAIWASRLAPPRSCRSPGLCTDSRSPSLLALCLPARRGAAAVTASLRTFLSFCSSCRGCSLLLVLQSYKVVLFLLTLGFLCVHSHLVEG